MEVFWYLFWVRPVELRDDLSLGLGLLCQKIIQILILVGWESIHKSDFNIAFVLQQNI